MATPLESLELKIRSILDKQAFDDAKKAVSETKKGVEDFGTAAGSAAGGITSLVGALGGLVSAGAALAFLGESAREAYEAEKSFRGVAVAAKTYGADLGTVKVRVDEAAKALSDYAGVADNEVVAGIGHAYLATGDLEQALARAKLAADIARGSTLTFSAAMEIVERTAAGMTRGLKTQFGIVAEGETEYEKAQDGLDKLSQRFREGAKAVDDNALALDRSRARWDRFKEQIGSDILPLVVKAKDFTAQAWNAVLLLFETIGARVVAVGKLIGAFFGGMTEAFAGQSGAWKRFADEAKRIEAERIATVEELETAAMKREEARETHGEDVAQKIGKQRVLASKELAGAKEKNEKEAHDYTLELIRSRQMAEESMYRRLQLEFEAYAAERKKAEEEIRKIGVDVEKKLTEVQEIEFNKRAAAQRKFDKEYEKESERLLRENAKFLEGALTKELSAREKLSRWVMADLKVRLAAERTASEARMAIAEGALAFGQAAFGDTKEIAIAAATISTYQAAARALADWPYPYSIVVAALAIATGLAQVAKIISTNPGGGTSSGGGGFDVPAHDYAAYLGGRKWAQDMISEFSKGASSAAGWASGMGVTNSTVDNSRHVNVTLQGAGLLDPMNVEMVKQFSRTLRIVERQVEGQRTLAWATRK